MQGKSMRIDKFNMFFSLVLLLLVLILINNNAKVNNSIFTDYAIAKKASIKENKPLFVCFNSSLSKQKISDFKQIKKKYIICILDYEKDKELFEKYKIKEIPTYAVLYIDNKIVIESGYKEKRKLFEWLNQLGKN